MKIEYSTSVDALYIKLREANVADTRDIEEGVTVDLDDHGHIVGLEILDAREPLAKVPFRVIPNEERNATFNSEVQHMSERLPGVF